MLVESRTEFSCQEGFFLTGLAGESDEEHTDGEQAAIFSDQERGAERCKQQPGVDRVANVGVGAGADKLVPFFDLHFGAPVFADGPAGPDGEEDPCGAKAAAEPGDPQLIGDESMIQRTPVGIFLIQQEETSGHEDDVEHAFGGILALRGSFYAESGDEPVEREEDPETVDYL